jgi:hypothetical protein
VAGYPRGIAMTGRALRQRRSRARESESWRKRVGSGRGGGEGGVPATWRVGSTDSALSAPPRFLAACTRWCSVACSQWYAVPCTRQCPTRVSWYAVPLRPALPAARCPLPAARCPLPAARCPLPAARCRALGAGRLVPRWESRLGEVDWGLDRWAASTRALQGEACGCGFHTAGAGPSPPRDALHVVGPAVAPGRWTFGRDWGSGMWALGVVELQHRAGIPASPGFVAHRQLPVARVPFALSSGETSCAGGFT